MKKIKAKIACGALAVSMTAAVLAGCGSTAIDGTQTALVINDEEITLGQANFMLRYQQASTYSYYYQMYSMYGMQMPSQIFDQTGDDGKTTGESMKEQALEAIEKQVLLRQHAEEYNVVLTDEEKEQAKVAAEAYAEKNGDEQMAKLGATVEDIEKALELYVIQSRIYDPMIADVDTEVDDEEAKQSSVSYVRVSTAGTEQDADGNTIELTDEEKAEKKEIAQRFLDSLKAAEDPATASFTDLRNELNTTLNEENPKEETDGNDDDSSSETSYLTASTASFSTGEKADTESDTTSLDDAVKEAVKGMQDGEIYDGIIEGENAYYVARMDDEFDEEVTAAKKDTIVSQRQKDAYDDLLEQWLKESDIKVKSCWDKLEVTDLDLYTLTVDSDSTDAAGDGADGAPVTGSSAEDGADGASSSSSTDGASDSSAAE